MTINISIFKNVSQYGLNLSLFSACTQGNLDKVKALLSSPELKIHADIHFSQDKPFKRACLNHHMDIIRFLIIDMNIEKTEEITKHLKDFPNQNIEKIFESRELSRQLLSELSSTISSPKKIKL